MLNDDEILTSVQAESDPVDDETDEDEDNNNKRSKDPSNAGTFSVLRTAMECISIPSLDNTVDAVWHRLEAAWNEMPVSVIQAKSDS
ncbi:hypothetical protein TNCV_4377471 [Trichonephila clavipes]|nr:hypothetical protein TNCV_4377471 [Trichonephila clavipes]